MVFPIIREGESVSPVPDSQDLMNDPKTNVDDSSQIKGAPANPKVPEPQETVANPVAPESPAIPATPRPLAKPPRKKSGPPPKAHRLTKKITVWCSPEEKVKIDTLARLANLSTSEFLRKNGLNKIVRIPRTLPGEVLEFLGELRTTNGLLYRIARKRDNNEVLNVVERAELEELGRQVKEVTDKITHNLQL
ncbi:plasmid mobilization protein [Flavitalea flava]